MTNIRYFRDILFVVLLLIFVKISSAETYKPIMNPFTGTLQLTPNINSTVDKNLSNYTNTPGFITSESDPYWTNGTINKSVASLSLLSSNSSLINSTQSLVSSNATLLNSTSSLVSSNSTLLNTTSSLLSSNSTLLNQTNTSTNSLSQYLNNSFAGTSFITALGIIASGTWQSTAIVDLYIASSAYWNGYEGRKANKSEVGTWARTNLSENNQNLIYNSTTGIFNFSIPKCVNSTFYNSTDGVNISCSSLPLIAKGDLLGMNATIPVRVPVGRGGQELIANSTVDAGVSWADRIVPIFRLGNVSTCSRNTAATAMAGLNLNYTTNTTTSGTIFVTIDFQIQSPSIATPITSKYQIAYANASATPKPLCNGAAVGTLVGQQYTVGTVTLATASVYNFPIEETVVISGLKSNTLYWFDVQATDSTTGVWIYSLPQLSVIEP